MPPEDLIILAVKLLFAALALAAVAAYVVLPILRMLRRTEDAEQVLKPFEPPPQEEIQIPTGGIPGKKLGRGELLDELRADPRRTATIMQQWLREKKRPGRPAPPKEG